MEGISLLLCNDLAGSKAIMDPIDSGEPSYGENELENAAFYPACAVTRAMRKNL